MTGCEYKLLTLAHPGSCLGIGIAKFVDGKVVKNWGSADRSICDALNKLGAEGWKLVQVTQQSRDRNAKSAEDDPVYIGRRPREFSEEKIEEALKETTTEEAIERGAHLSTERTAQSDGHPRRGPGARRF
jgi:hypothetical protein